MNVEILDKTGQPRSAEEFRKAREVATKRLCRRIPTDPADIELFVELGTIIEALRIAEAVASRLPE